MRIVIRFSPSGLVGGNHGIDVGRSSARYASLLREATRREFDAAEIDIVPEEGPSVRVEVTGSTDEAAQRVERSVLDLAWVVKQCAPWSVPG